MTSYRKYSRDTRKTKCRSFLTEKFFRSSQFVRRLPKCFCKLRKKNNLAFSAVILTAIFSLSFIVFSVSSQIKSDEPEQQKPSQQNVDDTPHNLVGAFYDVQNFPNAKLLLNNKDIVAREVRPTLYNLDGNIMEVAPVMVEANSFRMINLQDWATLGGESFRQGSIKLFHTGKDLVIGSQIYLSDETNSLSFEERLVELGKFDSHRQESIWWMPRRQADVKIVLSNTSDELLTVTARLSRKPRLTGEAQTFSLLPHQTKVLDLRNDFADGNQFANAEIVGLSLEHTGAKSALKAHGFIKDSPVGYSNIIEFKNPNSAKSSELHGTGLHLAPIGNEELEPMVAVKNVGNEPTNVTAKVPYTRMDGTNGRVNLAAINLRAGEMRLLNMNSVMQRSRQEQIKIAGIEIKYDTTAGSVLVNVQSVSNNKNQVFRVPMADPLAQVSATGGYPWRIEETSRTVSYIKNMSNLEQEYIASLNWENGGKYVIGLKKIAPHKTVEIDVKKLRDEQTPDFRGITIPLQVTSGQIKWTLRQTYQTDNPKNDRLALIGRSEQIDTTNGMSSSYACQNCCFGGDFSAFISTNPYGTTPLNNDYDFEVGDIVQYYTYLVHTDCYGNEENCPINTNDWSSNHTNIATVTSSGLVSILSVGDVRINTNVSGYINFEGVPCSPENYLHEDCENEPEKESQKVNANLLAPGCGECESQPSFYSPDADISAKPKVTNVISDTEATKISQNNVLGNQNFIHFVTPKGATNSQITLTATLSQSTQQILNDISWEGATESTSNPLQATVPKDTAAKKVVKIKYKGNTIKELRVWVVWTEVVERSNDGVGDAILVPKFADLQIGNATVFNARIGIDISFTFYVIVRILPASIVDSNETNRPDLSGANISSPPGGVTVDGRNLSNGANTKWDMSRRLALRSNILSLMPPFSTNLVKNDLCVSYPNDAVIGNDDAEQMNEELTNPYSIQQFPQNLGPGQLPIGQMLSSDQPRRRFQYFEVDGGSVNDMYSSRLWFQEFSRLEIQGQWNVISDPVNWRVEFKMLKKPVTENLWQFDANNDGVINNTIITEVMINADANGDGDIDDQLGYWDNNTSTSANNNSSIPLAPCPL